MHLKESKRWKRRKLDRTAHNTRRAPPKFSYVFHIPPARLGSELSLSTLSPPRSETPTESLLSDGDSSMEHDASHQDGGSSTERAAIPQDDGSSTEHAAILQDDGSSTERAASPQDDGSSTEHAVSPQDDGSSTERAASPQDGDPSPECAANPEDGDKTPTQSSFETQLPPLPSEILNFDENLHPDSHPDYKQLFLEGYRNVSNLALRPFPLVSATAPIRFQCNKFSGQGQIFSQASTPQCDTAPETNTALETNTAPKTYPFAEVR